jgi:uncharacterized membrane protein YdjX (TVP38/TMEM64 family)
MEAMKETTIDKKRVHFAMNIAIGFMAIVTFAFVGYGLYAHLFTSQIALEAFLTKVGVLAFFVFIIFQAVQVVFPILPGGIGLLAGVLIFGPWTGFIYNYIGICVGSILAFLIAKHYGTPIIKALFSEKMQKKYMKWAENKTFPRLFAIAIFMPVAPDDFLCYLAGTTNMTLKRFTTIIVLGKPMAIAAYSYGLDFIFQHAVQLFH